MEFDRPSLTCYVTMNDQHLVETLLPGNLCHPGICISAELLLVEIQSAAKSDCNGESGPNAENDIQAPKSCRDSQSGHPVTFELQGMVIGMRSSFDSVLVIQATVTPCSAKCDFPE
jgi:hypothetical protein